MAQRGRGRRSINDYLPPELVSAVFEVSTSQDGTSPLTLAAVSKAWHRLAWSTPDIWTFVYISVQKSLTTKRARFFEDWVRRSGRLPLSITFFVDYSMHEDLPQVHRLIRFLNGHCDRWYSLDLAMPSSLLSLFTTSGVRSTLYHLSLDPIVSDVVNTRLLLSEVSPKVVAIKSGLRFNIHDLNGPSITDLTLCSEPIDCIIRILQSVPNLRNCRLDFVEHPIRSTDRVILEKLESLQIEFHFRGRAALFFDNVKLPKLKHLAVRNVKSNTDTLVSFLHRSRCPLISLKIIESEFGPDEFVQVLQSTPFLETLEIMRGGIIEGHLQNLCQALTNHLPNRAINVPTSTKPCLPLLKCFKWSGKGPFPCIIIPWFLAPVSQDRGTGNRRRPLKIFDITCEREASDLIPYLDKKDISQVEMFQEEVKFKFTDQSYDHLGSYRKDLFRLSRENIEKTKKGTWKRMMGLKK